jgi:YggT family protein
MLTLFRVIGGLISAYLLLLFIRILLTWFQGTYLGKPYELLAGVTDPYLNLFRRFRWLQSHRMDFSPILALISLVILLNIVNTLAALGTITLGIILAIVLSSIWSAVSFLLTLYIVLIVIRFIAHLVGANTVTPFMQTLDMIINPVMGWIMKKLFKSRPVTYRFSLTVCGGGLLLTSLVGNILINQIIRLLQSMPV